MTRQIPVLLVLSLCIQHASGISLEQALQCGAVNATITVNPKALQRSESHTGRCLRILLSNTGVRPIYLTIPNAYRFSNHTNHTDHHQDLINCEQKLLALQAGQSVTLNLNTLCCERNDGSPNGLDTFSLSGTAGAPIACLCNWLEAHRLCDNSAQQAMWCLTDNSPIDNIFDTHADTAIENQLARLVATEKGLPLPKRFNAPVRILRYPIDVEGRYRQWIASPTTIGIFITDSANTILITLMPEEKETRTGGNLTYTYGYRGLLPKGSYYLQARVNGEWKREKEIVVGERRE